MVMAATNFHPVQPIVEAVETVGKNPWSETRTKRPGAESYNKIYMKLATERKHLLKNPRKNPTVRKTKKTQIRSRGPWESPSAAKAFNDAQLQASSNTTWLEGNSTGAIQTGPRG